MGALSSTLSSSKSETKELAAEIYRGNLEKAMHLISLRPALLAAKESGNNLLHLAVLHKQHDILEKVLTYVRTTSGTPSKRERALQLGAQKALNQGRTSDGATPLMLACQVGDDRAVRVLLAAGADTWCRDAIYGRTCLHFAATCGNVSVLRPVVEHSLSAAGQYARPSRSLLRSKAEDKDNKPLIDIGTYGGFTPLMHAMWFDQPVAVHELLKLGANIKCRSSRWGRHADSLGHYPDPFCRVYTLGSSALHIAAIKGSFFSAKAILAEYVASLSPERQRPRDGLVDPRLLIDCDDRTPFAVARHFGRYEMLHMLNPLTADPLADQPLPLHAGRDAEALEDCIVVPRLVQIAAKVAQGVLLDQVHALAQNTSQPQAQRAPSLRRSLGGTPGEEFKAGVAGPTGHASLACAQLCSAGAAHARGPRTHHVQVMLPVFECSAEGGAAEVDITAYVSSPFAKPGPQQALGAPVAGRASSSGGQGELDEVPESSLESAVAVTADASMVEEALAARRARQRVPISREADGCHVEVDPGRLSPASSLSDSQVEDAFAACRFHRLVNGVDSFLAAPEDEGRSSLLGPRVHSIVVALEVEDAAEGGDRPSSTRASKLVVTGMAAMAEAAAAAAQPVDAVFKAPRHSLTGGSCGGHASSTAAPRGSARVSLDMIPGIVVDGPEGAAAAAAVVQLLRAVSIDRASSVGSVDELEAMCGVCMEDGGSFIAAKPCGHKICVNCATELIKLHTFKPVPCPFCRSLVRGFGPFMEKRGRKH